ncbi:MAG: Tfp pilus assembly protein PilF [Halioglobus sp.]|jgi:Tfp pilus assembly protein PilF
MLHTIGKGVGLCMTLLLGACGTLPDSGPTPVERRQEGAPETAAPTSAQPFSLERRAVNSAAQNLMDKAGAQLDSGNYEQALALLERALRIDSDSGEIYLALVKTYSLKGDTAMANAAAQRGMLYCSDKAQCDALRAYTP